jgi:hypothetical protein
LLSLFQEMLATERRAAAKRKSFRLALAVSLALHALVIFYPLLLDQPLGGTDASPHHVTAPLQARIYKRAQVAEAQSAPSAPATEQRKRTKERVLSSKQGKWDLQKQPEARKPTGAELARRALAMARGMGRIEEDGGEDAFSTQQEARLKEIDPLSLEWYFNSFISKLNRSARFVPREPRQKGQRAAEVEIIINRDGSLREYKVIRAADRQMEVDYIRAVVERAVPFSAFPNDISSKTDVLSLTICIQPPGESGSGAGFTRTSGKKC